MDESSGKDSINALALILFIFVVEKKELAKWEKSHGFNLCGNNSKRNKLIPVKSKRNEWVRQFASCRRAKNLGNEISLENVNEHTHTHTQPAQAHRPSLFITPLHNEIITFPFCLYIDFSRHSHSACFASTATFPAQMLISNAIHLQSKSLCIQIRVLCCELPFRLELLNYAENNKDNYHIFYMCVCVRFFLFFLVSEWILLTFKLFDVQKKCRQANQSQCKGGNFMAAFTYRSPCSCPHFLWTNPRWNCENGKNVSFDSDRMRSLANHSPSGNIFGQFTVHFLLVIGHAWSTRQLTLLDAIQAHKEFLAVFVVRESRMCDRLSPSVCRRNTFRRAFEWVVVGLLGNVCDPDK